MPSSKNSWAPQHTNSHKETRAPSSRRASTLLSKLNPLPYLPRIRLKSLRSLTLNPYATVRRAKSSYRTYRHTWRRSKPLFFIYTLVLLAMLFAAYLTFEFAIDLVIMGPANATLEWLKYWTVFTLKVHVYVREWLYVLRRGNMGFYNPLWWVNFALRIVLTVAEYATSFVHYFIVKVYGVACGNLARCGWLCRLRGVWARMGLDPGAMWFVAFG